MAGFSVGNILYDYNGNIKSLKRQATNLEGVYVLDDLSYTYENADVSNRLQAVDDVSGETGGFKDGHTGPQDYNYDDNGNLESDANKDITSIEYNILNLPKRIVFANGNEILYTYDAAGTKLRKEVREDVEGTVIKTVTDYMSGVQYTIDDYQGANETTRRDFVMTPEGRATTEDGAAVSTAYNYEYNLTDHLGNVRATFTTKEEAPDEYLATFETAEQPSEALDFQNYGDAVIIPSTLYNHTNSAGADKSVRLSGIAGEIIGLAKSIAVVPGDAVHMEVYGKYWSPTANDANLGGILGAVAGAFGVGSPTTPDAQAAYDALSDLFGMGPFLDASDWENPNAPKVFLNYILFDKDYVPYFYDIDQIDIAANEDGSNIPHDYLTLTANVTKPGYIYIYLSNENDKLVDTFFDDFKITHTKSPIISADDYYPFGLAIQQNSYQREGATDQKYKFQGQEHQDDLDLGWVQFKYRMHDPAIGRFMVVDPLAEDYLYNSPYAFSENKVIAHVELEGLEAEWFALSFANSKERIRNERGEAAAKDFQESVSDAAGGAALLGLGLTPVGFAEDIVDLGIAISSGNAGNIAMAIIGFVPGGDILKKGKKLAKKIDNVSDATKNRVKLRKATKEQILDDAPKTEGGDFIDPNTGKIVPKEGPFDIGHKKGQEWKKRKKMHEKKGSTRKEVIEAENDPSIYQVEDPSSNRSRKFEEKE